MKIVFVQLANTPKKYVWRNIAQSKVLFPSIEHVLITDQPQVIKEAQKRNISTWRYETECQITEIFESMQTDKLFRSGFWRYTLERLIALTKFQQSTNNEAILHVESDVILATNFPFKQLTEISKVLWLPYNSIRDVASLLYIPNSSESIWFENEIIHEIDKDSSSTDMTVLNKIANRTYPRVGYFPVIEQKNSSLLAVSATETFVDRASHYSNHFSGIFDAAPLGMWITGQDPRNNRGYILRHSELPDSSVDPKKLEGQLNFDEERKMYFRTNQVFNLHIHSKQNKYFGLTNWNIIYDEINKVEYWNESRSFSLTAFYDLLKGFLRRRLRKFI